VWFFTIYNKEQKKSVSETVVEVTSPPSANSQVDSILPPSPEQIASPSSEQKNVETPASPSKVIPASSTEAQEVQPQESEEIKAGTKKDISAGTGNSLKSTSAESDVAIADKNKLADTLLPTADNTQLVTTLYFNRKLRPGVKIFPPKVTRKLQEVLSNPNTYIVIIGHTDPSGSKEYNYKLGLQRAEKVKSILAKKGITPDRIKVFSKGEENPITTNKTTRGKLRNRRVEISVSKTF
jgi:OOP family OmpA-OmpF porin